MNRAIFWGFKVGFIGAVLASCSTDPGDLSSPAPEMIFGNPDYQAISYGGYRGLSREDGPTVEQLIDDVKILGAMDIKLLRTYNTSQFPQAERLLQAIREVKSEDPSFQPCRPFAFPSRLSAHPFSGRG